MYDEQYNKLCLQRTLDLKLKFIFFDHSLPLPLNSRISYLLPTKSRWLPPKSGAAVTSFIFVESMEIKGGISAESLICLEHLDRKSPDLWPECLPGFSEFASKSLSPYTPVKTPSSQSSVHLEGEDLKYMSELGQLTADQLAEHIKSLQNVIYQLSAVETKELNRQISYAYLHGFDVPDVVTFIHKLEYRKN
uniref:Uncharacterized protein n=1 Tax=Romanomermis culicivorax TaxID=13658 RepID=A0A915KUZ5_ROMCU